MDQLSSELNKLKLDKTDRRSGSRRWVWLAGALILVAGGAAVVLVMQSSASTVVVDIVRPALESGDSSTVLIATGYVIANHKVQLSSKIVGKVAWIGVEKGDRVRQGQVLVRIEDREYRAQVDQARASFNAARARLDELESGSRPEEIDRAKAELERAEAQLRTDEANFRRYEQLVKEGVFPAQTLDEVKGRFDSSKANAAALAKIHELVRQGPRREQIDAARAEVERSRGALEFAQTMLDATEIRAPKHGVILERIVEPGEMVTTSFVGDRGAKSSVVSLADLLDLQVELDINQNDFNRIRPDQQCTAVTDAFPDRIYKCQVDEIAPEADRQKATIQVKVKILDPDEQIKPEMNARVTFLAEKKQAALPDRPRLFVIPARAILDRDGGKTVLTVVDGRIQARPVSVERQIGDSAYVSQGLTGDEAIVVGELLASLKSGDAVQTR